MTDTTPEYPYCVTVTKPDLPTVHLGFPSAHHAEYAFIGLREQMHHTAHPVGTEIAWGPTPDTVTPLPPVIATVDWLVQAMDEEAVQRAEEVGIEGERFPDLYARLRAQEPYDTASRLWQAACNLLDMPGEDDESEAEEPASLAELVARSSVGDRDEVGNDLVQRMPRGRVDAVMRRIGYPAPALGVTAGYDVQAECWHIEIHRPGQDIETIGIHAPLTANEETARRIAEQIAANLELPYLENNTGIIPAAELLAQVREAVWLPVEAADDAALLAEIQRLHSADQEADSRGWTRTTPAVIESDQPRVLYQAGDALVEAIEGAVIVSASSMGYTPEDARTIGTALIAAAKRAEELQVVVPTDASGDQ